MPVRILEISWSGFWRFLDRHSINFELMVLEDYLELDKILETGNQLRYKFLFLVGLGREEEYMERGV